MPSAPPGESRDGPPPTWWLGPTLRIDLRVLIPLALAALISRLTWVLRVHPPAQYVFSDMRKYIDRARDLAEHGIHPDRTLAWQSWGTHYLIAGPLRVFGSDNLVAPAVMYGLMGAGAVVVGYLLAVRVCERKWMPAVFGVVLLVWHPNLSTTGYFLSEPPFLFVQLLSTYLLVVVLQTGRAAAWAGLVSALAFAVRPQSALFFLLVFLTWALVRKRLPHVRIKTLVQVAVPLLLMLGFTFWRFHLHTGHTFGVAENANMNLTAGRCHNIVTQAFRNQRGLDRSNRRRSTRDGRRVSLPGFRVLGRNVPPNHPLALRPALRSESIKFVGYIGDAGIHRQIRKSCFRATGVVEQARYSVVNASLLWFYGRQWPEMEKGRKRFYRYVEFYRRLYQWAVWLPSLLGMAWVLARLRRRPAMALVGWQLVTSVGIAAIFFGTIRLRTPYDPYALLLALLVYAEVGRRLWTAVRTQMARRRAAPAVDPGTDLGHKSAARSR